MEINFIFKEANNRMDKSIAALQSDLKKMRTGRASASLLDGIKADFYGTLTSLSQMSSISVPESCLITIQPWDASSIKEIEKSIMKSDLGLTPSNDGKIIKIPIPPLTEMRRKELVKLVRKLCEEYKIAIRNVRRDSNETLKQAKKDKDISEDELFKFQEKIQKITNEYISKTNQIEDKKVKEILEF